MLDRQRKGYAVMTEELDAYSFEDESLETCKRYCRKGYVVAEQIPVAYGFSLRVTWHKYHKPIYLKLRWREMNIFWLHIRWNKEYTHKTGKIVFRAEDKN